MIYAVCVDNGGGSHRRIFTLTVIAEDEDVAIMNAAEKIHEVYGDSIVQSIRNSDVRECKDYGVVGLSFHGDD